MSSYRALYRKYRPVDFDDVVGQGPVTDILKYEVANGKLSHAYLFCGSRGTGKTSCAKILAKAVNCENPRNGNPCNECAACRSIDAGTATDVIEMDAASNNGVDKVRDMKDEIAFTPALLKYRVYIIDEVHMMSVSAFNALLKTLEEPPSYVIFILATTEFNKLPTTIVSRCQRFDFKRMTNDVLVGRLKKIAEKEGIDLADDGAAMLARAAEGGMRDAVSLLELCAGSRERIDSELVFRMIGRGNRQTVYGVVESILAKDYAAIYKAVDNIVMTGADLSVFWQELLDAYRDIAVVKNLKEPRGYLDLTDVEFDKLGELASKFTMAKLLYHVSVLEGTVSDLQRAKESKRSVAELALTKMCEAKLETSSEALLFRIEELEAAVSRLKFSSANVAQVESAPEKAPAHAAPNTEPKAAVNTERSAPTESVYADWHRVVGAIETAKPAMYSPLSKAVAIKCSDGSFIIKVDPFFVKIISENSENISILRGIIAENEKLSPENIRVSIEPKRKGNVPNLADELERAINRN